METWTDTLDADVARLAAAAAPRGSQLDSCALTGLDGKLRKRFATYAVAYRNGDPRGRRQVELLAKVYRNDRGATAYEALGALWEAGFRPPATERVPRPYGYLPERCALVQERVTGTPWAASLHHEPDARRRTSEAAARWLLRLHCSGVPAEPGETAADLARLRRYARELAAAYPESGADVRSLAARLARRQDAVPHEAVPSHGDFHPKNVLLRGGVVTAIDFDTFAARDPEADLGYAVAQLLVMSFLRLGSFASGAEAGLAFLRRYRAEAPAGAPRIAAYAARTFLQSLHYELCVLHSDRVELLARWPELAQRWLESHDDDLLEDLVRGR